MVVDALPLILPRTTQENPCSSYVHRTDQKLMLPNLLRTLDFVWSLFAV